MVNPTAKTKTPSSPRPLNPATSGPAYAREVSQVLQTHTGVAYARKEIDQQFRRSASARRWTEHQLVSFRLMAIKDCRVAAVARKHLVHNRMDIQLGLIDDIMVFDLFTEKSLKIPERFDYVPSIHPVIQKRARIIIADSNRDDHLQGLAAQPIFMWERQFTYLPKNKELIPCDLRLSETTIACSSPTSSWDFFWTRTDKRWFRIDDERRQQPGEAGRDLPFLPPQAAKWHGHRDHLGIPIYHMKAEDKVTNVHFYSNGDPATAVPNVYKLSAGVMDPTTSSAWTSVGNLSQNLSQHVRMHAQGEGDDLSLIHI